jgi:hypothetical protein
MRRSRSRSSARMGLAGAGRIEASGRDGLLGRRNHGRDINENGYRMQGASCGCGNPFSRRGLFTRGRGWGTLADFPSMACSFDEIHARILPRLGAQEDHPAGHVRRGQDLHLRPAAPPRLVPFLRRLPHRHPLPGRAHPGPDQAAGHARALPEGAAAQRLDRRAQQHQDRGSGAGAVLRRQAGQPGFRRFVPAGIQPPPGPVPGGGDRRHAGRARVHPQGPGNLRLRPFRQRRGRQPVRTGGRLGHRTAGRAHPHPLHPGDHPG